MNTFTLHDYHKLAMRTSPMDGHDKIDNGMLGLIGETGELTDLYKKHVYQSVPGTQFPSDAAINELGDILWYLAELTDGMETSLGDVSNLTFDDMDNIVSEFNREVSLREVILNLSGHAARIRKAVKRNAPEEIKAQVRKMLFCCALMANVCGVTLSTVAYKNIEKLRHRYPNGFDARTSMQRSMKEYTHDDAF